MNLIDDRHMPYQDIMNYEDVPLFNMDRNHHNIWGV
jgi:hypothetical protein